MNRREESEHHPMIYPSENAWNIRVKIKIYRLAKIIHEKLWNQNDYNRFINKLLS